MATLVNVARIEKAAQANGWTVDDDLLGRNGKLWIHRGHRNVMVQFTDSGAVASATYGPFGMNKITGEDKVGQIVELFSKEA